MSNQLLDKGNQYKYKEQNPQYHGEPLNHQMAQGPAQDRSCKDCFFAILFLAFWAGLIVIAVVAIKTGDPSLLASPFDASGKQCGKSSGYQDYKYVYFNQRDIKNFTCINFCPKNSSSSPKCKYNNTQTNCSQFYIYQTTKGYSFQLVVNLCLPAKDQIFYQIGLTIGEQWISDLQHSWPILLATIGFALIFSLILMFFIRCCGGFIIWTMIVLYFVLVIGLGFLFFYVSYNENLINPIVTEPKNLRIFAYVCWAIGAISFIIFCCFCRKIKIAIAIIKAAADYTRQQCQSIIIPLIMLLSMSVFFVLWTVITIYLFSSGEIPQSKCSTPYGCIQWNEGVKRMVGYYFVGLFWNCEFAIALSQFVIASSAAYWYFRSVHEQPTSPILLGYCRGLFYNFGSIALGSLILCIMVILRILFQIFNSVAKQKSMGVSQNCLIKCCINCARCCLACFQRFLRFVSKNAFILMALTGQSFCSSAQQGFYLSLRMFRQFAITQGLGNLVMFFGKLFVTSLATLCSYMMITQIQGLRDKIFEPYFPTFICAIIAYVISSIFMDLFGYAADSILMFYMVQMDIRRHVRYCPAALKQFLQEYS